MMPAEKKRLRIALVFPPAVLPTSAPLGISCLKAWLESSPVGADIEVRNFDLNLDYFELALRWLGEQRLRMSLEKMDSQATAQKVRAATDFLRGMGPDSFFDLNRYNDHAAIYTRFGLVLNGLFDSFARKILLGRQVPELVSGFFDRLLYPIRSFEPDLVGFSILFSQQLFFALALAKLSKTAGDSQSQMKIALGGATFSVMPDPGRILASVALNVGNVQAKVDPSNLIDYLVVGEGEEGLEGLVKSRLFPSDATPGLVYRKEGKICQNPAQGVRNLNTLPLPDFGDTPPHLYHSPEPVLPYLSSRGCPWRRCAFCTHQRTYLDYREERAEITVERISLLQKKYGVNYFSFVDEMLYPERVEKISARLVGNKTSVRFCAYARPKGFSASLFKRAHGAGLRLLLWGVESGSRRVLDLMGKGTDPAEVKTILDCAHAAGIWNLLFVMFGFPTETSSEWHATLDFLDSCRECAQALSRSRFLLLEGSRVFRDPQRYGISRIMDRPQRDPVSIAYDYEVSEGLGVEEAAVLFKQSLPRLSKMERSPWFGQLREHMLLYASQDKPLSSNLPVLG
jgi:radical SAM superfamily enzyme YgiQ (UPF0313 family)